MISKHGISQHVQGAPASALCRAFYLSNLLTEAKGYGVFPIKKNLKRREEGFRAKRLHLPFACAGAATQQAVPCCA